MSSVVADGGLLVLESALLIDEDRDAFLYCPTGGDSPYEPTSVSFFNLKALTDTLGTFGLEVEETRMTPSLESRLHSLRGLREKAKDVVRELLDRRRKPSVGRVTMICRKTGSGAVPELDAYWSGTHTVHTDMYLPERKKKFWWMGR